MGVAVELGPDGVAECIEKAGVGFMFAPTYHPAMKVCGCLDLRVGWVYVWAGIGFHRFERTTKNHEPVLFNG